MMAQYSSMHVLIITCHVYPCHLHYVLTLSSSSAVCGKQASIDQEHAVVVS